MRIFIAKSPDKVISKPSGFPYDEPVKVRPPHHPASRDSGREATGNRPFPLTVFLLVMALVASGAADRVYGQESEATQQGGHANPPDPRSALKPRPQPAENPGNEEKTQTPADPTPADPTTASGNGPLIQTEKGPVLLEPRVTAIGGDDRDPSESALDPDIAMIAPGELIPGMRGYGLSVFKGHEPERFEVEVVGVLENSLPDQDIVLIRVSGHDLERTRVIAGMSGSPIFIEGRLLGALAYGWNFSQDPIAGVTPIKCMMKDASDRRNPLSAPGPSTGLDRLTVPLFASGAPASVIQRFRPAFAKLGLGGVTSLGSAASDVGPAALAASGSPERPDEERTGPRERSTVDLLRESTIERSSTHPTAAPAVLGTEFLTPGGVLAVYLAQGDLSITSVGTITHRMGDTLLAYGHPFTGLGPLEAPIASGWIHTILSRYDISFKMSQASPPCGSLVWDGQTGVVGRIGMVPSMVDLNVSIIDSARLSSRTFRMQVIDNPLLTPVLMGFCLASCLARAGGSSRDLTVDSRLEVTYDQGKSLTLGDQVHLPPGEILPPGLLEPAFLPTRWPSAPLKMSSLTARMSFTRARLTARIERVWCSLARVRPGESIPIHVLLRTHSGQETRLKLEMTVPHDIDDGELEIVAASGSLIQPPVAEPETVDQLLKKLGSLYGSHDLVVRVRVPGDRVSYRGHLLDRLPPSTRALLGGAGSFVMKSQPRDLRVVRPTEWVLDGSATSNLIVSRSP